MPRWAELCPLPKFTGEALTCKVQNAAALGGRVFKEAISSNEALRVALAPPDCCPYRKRRCGHRGPRSVHTEGHPAGTQGEGG